MINAKLVDIDNLTLVDVTDPATDGIIYRYYNSVSNEYEFYVVDSANLRKILLENETPDFRNEFMML